MTASFVNPRNRAPKLPIPQLRLDAAVCKRVTACIQVLAVLTGRDDDSGWFKVRRNVEPMPAGVGLAAGVVRDAFRGGKVEQQAIVAATDAGLGCHAAILAISRTGSAAISSSRIVR